MSFRTVGGPRLPSLPRPPRLLIAVVAAVAVLVIAFVIFVAFYTNLLWFRSVGFSSVYTTRLGTQILLFVVFGAIMAIAVGVNIVVAYRLRPPFRPLSTEQHTLERYRVAIDPHRTAALVLVVAVVGVLTGAQAAGRWRTWLLWRNAVPFHQRDLQFHKDIGYFAFSYPFQRFILGYLFTVVVLSLVAATVTHYIYGGLRVQTPGEKVSPAARAHLSVLLGSFVVLKAAAYWLDRYGLAFSGRGIVTGPSYTDVNAVLPAKTILVVVALICAGLFFANVFRRGWLLPTVGFGLLVLSAVVIGGIYPFVVQQFQVKPSAVDKERPYIARNIQATRQAYDLTPGSGLAVVNYAGVASASADAARTDAGTLPNIRLLDPNLLHDTWQQLQGFKNFYSFPEVLDIDRYTVDESVREEVVAVRDINIAGLTPSQQNWINEHLVYTHGYGFVAAPSNTADADGRPAFDQKDLPSTGDLGVRVPQIYFGENSPNYSIVGAPSGAPARELDYPSTGSVGQQNTTYHGSGGVPIGSTFRRLLYAMRFREKNILLSSGVNSASQILYNRDPRTRVQQVAPYLTLDGDPYPAVVGGRIVWIVDGYTTINGYPYSERESLSSLTADTLTQTTAVAAQASTQINYIRNSVKAVVDAYDGSVSLYQWDTKDPVLRTWMKAFPGTVKPRSAIPADLMAHLRYPEDLFKVQREVLARYHVSDPRAFFNGTDFWKVPDDPTRKGSRNQPPFYLTLQLPGDPSTTFALTSPLLANARPNLAAFVSVDSNPTSPNYGKLRVLQVPSDVQVDGPGQVFNNFETNPDASKQLSLLRGPGSDTVEGNLLTLPFGGGLLYVEPIYLRSKAGASYPTLQQVFVSYNGRISFQSTLQQALLIALGAASPPPTSTSPPPSSTGPPVTVSAAIRQAIADANAAFADGRKALQRGDFSAYGAAQTRLAAALTRLQQLTKRATATTPSASPTPSAPSNTPSPTTSASP